MGGGVFSYFKKKKKNIHKNKNKTFIVFYAKLAKIINSPVGLCLYISNLVPFCSKYTFFFFYLIWDCSSLIIKTLDQYTKFRKKKKQNKTKQKRPKRQAHTLASRSFQTLKGKNQIPDFHHINYEISYFIGTFLVKCQNFQICCSRIEL